MTDEQPAKPKARLKNYEQPYQIVVSRDIRPGLTWAHLACGHIEPATGKDLWKELRCEQCNPVPRGCPLPGWT
jgi:hypothetical protein